MKWKVDSGAKHLASFLDSTVFTEPYREVFHELFRLCKIVIELPASSASCKLHFSALEGIKNHLRTIMVHSRLSHLSILCIESRRAKTMNMDDFIKMFASQHKNN